MHHSAEHMNKVSPAEYSQFYALLRVLRIAAFNVAWLPLCHVGAYMLKIGNWQRKDKLEIAEYCSVEFFSTVSPHTERMVTTCNLNQ